MIEYGVMMANEERRDFRAIRQAFTEPDSAVAIGESEKTSSAVMNEDPRTYKGVMVSSTFTDLENHRANLMSALLKEDLFPVGMEHCTPDPGDDLISSSLGMVHRASAYAVIVGHRCGQVPECPKRNPNDYPLSRLEYEHAQILGRPTVVFVMADDHPLTTRNCVETDPAKAEKLRAFREAVTNNRVYIEFHSIEDFSEKAIHAVTRLRRQIEKQTLTVPECMPLDADSSSIVIPRPPTLYAEPPYIGSHQFVGRQAQLDVLNDWAKPADPNPLLLFDAIGGSGKSMLTWEWMRKHAPHSRHDWAGYFWYSFYEKGSAMADFCRHALAYITGEPLSGFGRIKALDLGERLLCYLRDKPWLMVLDGLERVLVHGQRLDAAIRPDQDASEPTDSLVNRDPCAAIHTEDDDLLRALAAASPSKVLITTRLVPRVLLNPASQPIPGVRREPLSGLRPSDAEALLRSCGVSGTSDAIQDFLQRHCDCHPLVTGVLAGLINDYLPARGDFDAWAADPRAGGALNLATLDLIQKHKHILEIALSAIPEEGMRMLSTLAVLSQAVDYPTLEGLNPDLPPRPMAVPVPSHPETLPCWEQIPVGDKKRMLEAYQDRLERSKAYERKMEQWCASPEVLAASPRLASSIHDLERRGLLLYDARTRHYDIHPVIRGVVAGRLTKKDVASYGQRVVDCFSERPHRPYSQAETIEELRDGITVVRTLLAMERYQQACNVYRNDLFRALLYVESYADILILLKPFFPGGWICLPTGLSKTDGAWIATEAANALFSYGQEEEAIKAYGLAIQIGLENQDWINVPIRLGSLARSYAWLNRLSQAERCNRLVLSLAMALGMDAHIFTARLDLFSCLSSRGAWDEAERLWQDIEAMGLDQPWLNYRAGTAEYERALFDFRRQRLTERQLDAVERVVKASKNRLRLRDIAGLRGEWLLQRCEYARAADSLRDALQMAREVGQTDAKAETQLVHAKLHLGQLTDPFKEAERLDSARTLSNSALASLWVELGDVEHATKRANALHKWACADGDPFVRRSHLALATGLLEKIGAPIPAVPPFDTNSAKAFPWEAGVLQIIQRLQKQKRGAEG